MGKRSGENKGFAEKAVIAALLAAEHVDARLAEQTELVLCLRVLCPGDEALGGDRADIVHRGQLERRGVLNSVHGAECSGKHFRRLLPYLPDTKRAEQPGKILLLALLDLVHEVFCGFLTHSVKRRNALWVEPVEIGRRFYHAAVYQRLGKRKAKTFNVHRLAGSKMNEIAQPLRRTFHARAAHRRAVRIAFHGRAALGACIRQTKRHRSLRASGEIDAEDFRDNFPRLAYDDRIADAHIELIDKVLIVEGCRRDGRTGEPHRLNDRLRRQNAGSADLHNNIAHYARLFLRRVLIRHRPARRLCGAAENGALRKIVDLDDRAVDIEWIALARIADTPDLLAALLHGSEHFVRHSIKPKTFQHIQRFRMRFRLLAGGELDIKNNDIEPALLRHLRVKLTHGSGGGVARIGKECFPLDLAAAIVLKKHVARHIYLAADDQPFGSIFQFKRDIAQDPEIFRHVLAGGAVAARRALIEHAVPVFERHRKPVDLWFDRVHRLTAESLVGLADEVRQFVIRKNIAERFERYLVMHRGEFLRTVAADMLRRRVRRNGFRMLRLQLFQTAHHRVIFKIGNGWGILVVIGYAVAAQFRAQFGDLL